MKRKEKRRNMCLLWQWKEKEEEEICVYYDNIHWWDYMHYKYIVKSGQILTDRHKYSYRHNTQTNKPKYSFSFIIKHIDMQIISKQNKTFISRHLIEK